MIDGSHAGYVEQNIAENMVNSLKMLKIEGKKIPKET